MAFWYDPDSCDLLKNSYLCLLNNTLRQVLDKHFCVVICWKIRIFAYWTTPVGLLPNSCNPLWFAEKFVSLLIEQHLHSKTDKIWISCDLLKNSYLCLLNNTLLSSQTTREGSCDLLKNSYLCLLNNTEVRSQCKDSKVVICWKIRIFAYWTTPQRTNHPTRRELWFAEKFVSLLIEQHPQRPL